MGLFAQLLQHWLTRGTRQLQADVYRERLDALKRAKELGEKPIYGSARDVAAEKPMPGVAEPPTYAESAARADVISKLPLEEIIQQKGSPELFKTFANLVMGPEAVEGATAGTMFPAKETRLFQQYIQIKNAIEAAKRKASGMEGAEVTAPVETTRAPYEMPKLDEMGNALDILMGVREKEKTPTVKALGPYQGLYKGEKIIREPGEKPRTGLLGEWDEWAKNNPGKTFGDYVEWKARTTSEARVKALSQRAKTDPVYKKALDIAFKVVSEDVDNYLRHPEYIDNPPTDADVALRIAITTDDLYKKLKGKEPLEKKAPEDVLGLQTTIQQIIKERSK